MGARARRRRAVLSPGVHARSQGRAPSASRAASALRATAPSGADPAPALSVYARRARLWKTCGKLTRCRHSPPSPGHRSLHGRIPSPREGERGGDSTFESRSPSSAVSTRLRAGGVKTAARTDGGPLAPGARAARRRPSGLRASSSFNLGQHGAFPLSARDETDTARQGRLETRRAARFCGLGTLIAVDLGGRLAFSD